MGRRLLALLLACGFFGLTFWSRSRQSRAADDRGDETPREAISSGVPGESTTTTAVTSTTLATTATSRGSLLASRPSVETTTTVLAESTRPLEAILAARHYDFIFCGNIAGTLGSALQAAKAYLILAYEFQQRGWSVLVVLPALGLKEFDQQLSGDGVALKRLLDLSPLKELLDLEEDLDTSVASRQAACGERSADVAVWSSVELRGAYGAVAVPHLWMGPGKERWMFTQLFENLEALSKGAQNRAPVRVFWQMQHYSGTQCAPFVFNRSERKIARAMRPREVEQEPCGFVYVSHILHKDGLWPLQSSMGSFVVKAKIETVGQKIGELLKEQGIGCADFYVKLLGLTGQDFVSRIQRGAEATPFTARQMKKRNCRLCMEGNMEVLQRAAGAPLLLAEPFTSWPDLPARRLLLRGRPVVYLYGDLAAKPRWDAKTESFTEAVAKVILQRRSCATALHRGVCVDEDDFECWPD